MVSYGKVIGGGGEFAATLKNKLQNFCLGTDYSVYSEAYGNVRRAHYSILSESLARELKEVNWDGLRDFESVEVSETTGPGEKTIDENQAAEVIVETFDKNFVDYQTTNPTKIPEEVYRQKVEIMAKQNNVKSSVVHNLQWRSKTVDHQTLVNMLKPNDVSSVGDAVYYRFERYDGEKKEVIEKGTPPSLFADNSNSTILDSNVIKICSNCPERKQLSSANFCGSCGRNLVVESQIREITDQEAQQIQQQQLPFFKPEKG